MDILSDPRGQELEKVLKRVADDLLEKQPIGNLEVAETILASLSSCHSRLNPGPTIKKLEAEVCDLKFQINRAIENKRRATLDLASNVSVPETHRLRPDPSDVPVPATDR